MPKTKPLAFGRKNKKLNRVAAARVKRLADDYGYVKAEVADAVARLAQVRQAIIDTGEARIEGDLFRVTVSEYSKYPVDWQAVVMALEQTPALLELIAKNTGTDDITTVKAVAR